MPSPFPGMDPYLEAPDIWPDLHDALAGAIRGLLNQTLPAPYYARLEMRPEVGVVEEGGITRRIVPDVAVVRRPQPQPGGVAVLDAPQTTISPYVEWSVSSEPIRHTFVEIRDPSRGHHLVTLIEIVSPSNKRPGPDRQAYLQKQAEILDSDTNLIELDFLRRGARLLPRPELHQLAEGLEPPTDYLVLVNRAWQRVGAALTFQAFPVRLTGRLPCVPVPLREGQAEPTLDLQHAFHLAYDSGPYRRGAIDYTRPPDPPLQGEAAAWAEQLLREQGLAGPPPAAPAGNGNT